MTVLDVRTRSRPTAAPASAAVQPVATPARTRTRPGLAARGSRLTSTLDELNALCRTGRGKVKKGFWKVKEALYEIRDNTLMRYLSPAEYVVLGAIMARTLQFGKLVEVITFREFEHGVRDRETGELSVVEERESDEFTFTRHVFSGCGLTPKTIRDALTGLHDKGLITTFAIPRSNLPCARWPRAYMPCTVHHLPALHWAFAEDLYERNLPLVERLLQANPDVPMISDPRLDPLGLSRDA